MLKLMATRSALMSIFLAMLTPAGARAANPSQSAHSREFWRAIVKNRFAVPADEQVYPLIEELNGYLGSTDPELRDDLAYSVIGVWVRHQDLSTTQLNRLADEWRANLRAGIGESGTDTVFKRSFSALCLASLAHREFRSPFLGPQRYAELLSAALTYLHDERDLRGFDPSKGWIHATAHTADLLANLTANPLLAPQDQPRLLRALAEHLSSAHVIFSYGEQDRLANVAAVIAQRKDFDHAAFQRWLNDLNTDQKVWDQSPPRLELLQTFENDSYLLEALAAHLSAAPEIPQTTEARQAVLKILERR